MLNFNNLLYFKFLFKFNFIILSLIFILIIVFFLMSKFKNHDNYKKNSSLFPLMLLSLKLLFLISFFFHLASLYFYINCVYKFNFINFFSDYILVPSNINILSLTNLLNVGVNVSFSVDFFGLVLLTLAYLVGYISILAIDTRLT